MTNKKVLMKFKDVLNSKIITDFMGLKSKMCTFNYIDNDIITKKIPEKDIVLKYDKYDNVVEDEREYDEYNNIIINKYDNPTVFKYNKYDNIEVNKNTHKGIKIIMFKT